MTTLSPTFLVFDSNVGSKIEDGGVVYCSSNNAIVQWPKSARRGRPRKENPDRRRSLERPSEESKEPLRERYQFVDCSDKRALKDLNTRRFVRTHVMHNYLRRKKTTAHAKLGSNSHEIELRVKGAETVDGAVPPPILPGERWSRDPFDSFPMKMQPYMHDLLHLYVSAFADHLYPVEACWGLNPTKKVWMPLALTDSALLSSILFCGDQFRAMMNGQKERPSAITHLQKTIQILNQRLQDPSQEISDSTIAAVAALALTEQSSGNQANWRIHMRGVKQMVDRRGGLLAFAYNPILQDKICRADICGSLPNLSKPYLRIESSSRLQPSFPQSYPKTKELLPPGFRTIDENNRFDSEFLEILYRVHTITEEYNIVNPPKSETIPLSLRERMRSVQYYLLHNEKYNLSSSSDSVFEACRIGVLLYVGIIQNEFWVSAISKQVICQLKDCLQSQSLAAYSMGALRLWLSFLAGSIVFDPPDRLWFVCSIKEIAVQLSLSSWYDARLVLETFAWTGKIQDDSGADLWYEATSMLHPSFC